VLPYGIIKNESMNYYIRNKFDSMLAFILFMYVSIIQCITACLYGIYTHMKQCDMTAADTVLQNDTAVDIAQ